MLVRKGIDHWRLVSDGSKTQSWEEEISQKVVERALGWRCCLKIVRRPWGCFWREYLMLVRKDGSS